MSHGSRFAFLICALLIASCEVNPQPTPPPIFPSFLTFDGALIQAAPDAVAGREGVVLFADVFTDLPPIRVPVASDGSFGPVDWTDRSSLAFIRVEAGGPPGEPAYIEFLPGGGLRDLTSERADCFFVESFVDAGTVAVGEEGFFSVRLENQCELDIRVDDVTVRTIGAGFASAEPVPVTIPPGTETAVRIRFSPDAVGDFENFFKIGYLAPAEPPMFGSPLQVVQVVGVGE